MSRGSSCRIDRATFQREPLTTGVDVQKNRLVYVIRGWGLRQESWLIEQRELWGQTEHQGV